MNRFFGHFKTITAHRRAVYRHAKKVGIPWQGLTHDLSKFSPAEFFVGVKYYTGKRSPNEGERAAYGYSAAWLHHKGRNKHHFEYWTDCNPAERRVMPVKMPLKYCLEMLCDRVAASKTYLKDKYTDSHPLDYFRGGSASRSIHPETSALLESWLVMLKEKGEDETLRYLRAYYKEHKKDERI
jgi:hypothetical protein